MHTANNMHTWGRVQLRRITWDLYVQSPTSVTQEMSDNSFTIQEPGLPIASKRQVTHYPRVTKRKSNMANGLNHQPNKQSALTS